MRVRRPLIGIGVVVLLLVAGGFATRHLWLGRADTGGALVVDPDPIVFPTAKWGERIQRSFTLTNRSKRSVLVKDPTFSCACFRIDRPAPFAALQPGQSVSFDVIMESAQSGSPGRVHKEMTIVSDDPVVPKLVVPVLGHLRAYRKIEPRDVTLKDVDPAGDVAEQKVTVRADMGFSVTVLKAEADDKARVAVEVKPVEGGADVWVRTVKGAPSGPIGSSVRLTLRIDEKVDGRDAEPETVVESVWVRGRVK